jgi:histidinol-phosphate aminotransferase
MPVRDAVRRIPPYRLSADRAEVKLNQNESPYDLPDALKREALKRVAEVPFHRYPDLQADDLRERIGLHHEWPADGVVVTGGSNVLIQCIVIACGLGRTVLTVEPTFAVYRLEAELLGTELIEERLAPGFGLPTEALLERMTDRRGVLFLTDPAAPTGNRLDPEGVRALVHAAGNDWTVVIDEAYAHFSGRDHLDLVRASDDVVSLRTFSKAFGLGGVRLGYALTSPELAGELRKVALPFSVSALQMAIGAVVLEHPELIEDRIAEAIAERRRLAAALEAVPDLTVFPSETNFVLFRCLDPEWLFTALLERGVLVRRQDHLPGLAGCLRVSVGQPHENDRLLAALSDALSREGVGEHVRSP